MVLATFKYFFEAICIYSIHTENLGDAAKPSPEQGLHLGLHPEWQQSALFLAPVMIYKMATFNRPTDPIFEKINPSIHIGVHRLYINQSTQAPIHLYDRDRL